MSARHLWTEADDGLLRERYGRESGAAIAAALGVSMSALYCRVTFLGLASQSGRPGPARAGRLVNPSSSWSRMEALLKERGVDGLSLEDAGVAMPHLERKTVNNTLNRLVMEGRAFKVGGGKGSPPRYFATSQDRAHWIERNPVQSDTLGRKRATPWRRPPAAEPRCGGAALEGEPVMTERTRRVQAPRPPAHRFEVREPVVGGMRTDGIGRYQEPASSWVAALTGAAS